MSKFAAYLRELLDQRGEPISRVARNAGLERTSIHKALKDERLLPYTALKKLTHYLQLTLSQTRELNLYYEILLQGEDTYRVRKAIVELLSSLSQLHFSCRELYAAPPAAGSAAWPEFVFGRPQVEAALQAALAQQTQAGPGPPPPRCTCTCRPAAPRPRACSPCGAAGGVSSRTRYWPFCRTTWACPPGWPTCAS